MKKAATHAKRSAKRSAGRSAKPAHRYSKKVRVLTVIGSSLMAVLGVLCITVAIVISSFLGRINFVGNDPYDPNADVELDDDSDIEGEEFDESQYTGATEVAQLPLRGNENGVRNILLLGIDSTNYSGRSDVNMILSINDKTKTIKLVSLLRDTWVTIPGRDKDGDGQDDVCKLNAAYAYGKHTLQSKMIAQNFRLDIEDYIGVNFATMPVVIDAVGGVDITLTAKEMTQIPADGCNVAIPTPGKDCDGVGGFTCLKGEPGTYHLNGFQAMQYARIRKIDSDFQRTGRQQIVVEKILQKAKSMSYTQLVSVMYKALDCVDTNMSSDEFLGFAVSAVKYMNYTVETGYQVPSREKKEYKGVKINGGAGLLLTDPKSTVQNLHQYLYG